MIKRCAKLEEKSVEQRILETSEGGMRGVAYELEYTGINVGFGDKEIDDVVYKFQSGGAA